MIVVWAKIPHPAYMGLFANLILVSAILLLKRERTDTGSLGHFSPLWPISSVVSGPILTKFGTETPGGSECVFAKTELKNSNWLPWKSRSSKKTSCARRRDISAKSQEAWRHGRHAGVVRCMTSCMGDKRHSLLGWSKFWTKCHRIANFDPIWTI